jgi:hypothetical protein
MTMEFVLLIHGTDEAYRALSPTELEKMYAEHRAFMGALKEAGIGMPYSAELDQPGAARLVRHVGDRQLITDGPFSETKEQLGGFYVIDVPTIDEAVSWAKRIPTVPGDTIEVRPAK